MPRPARTPPQAALAAFAAGEVDQNHPQAARPGRPSPVDDTVPGDARRAGHAHGPAGPALPGRLLGGLTMIVVMILVMGAVARRCRQ